MTLTKLLESVRRVEMRTIRLVNDTMVGAYLSHFKGRGMDFEELHTHLKPLGIESFGNCGEFAIIKKSAAEPALVLIPSNSMGLEIPASAVSRT